jgi:putative ABC transport system permease protein
MRNRAELVDVLARETRHAARRLVRSPAFSLAAILTLALAVGANASIFAVLKRVILDPLPFPDSDRLVELDHGSARLRMTAGMGITLGMYYQYADRARSFENIALHRTEALTLTGNGEPERIRVTNATTTLGAVLRVGPMLGRWFNDSDGRPGAAPAAVLSHQLWQRRYGGDPGVIGRSVRLGGIQTAIVGVMPAGFAFPDPRVDMWVAERVGREMGFGIWSYTAIARLRPGASLGSAQTELAGLIADMPSAFPHDALALGNLDIGIVPSIKTLKAATVGDVAPVLWMLFGSVGLVLIVGCANVANLFLVRSESRQREVAVRRALGASGAGVARYFLAESALLSLAGGALGLAVAWASVRLLVRYGPATLPRLNEVRLDAGIGAFTFGVSLLAAAAFGALPLWHAGELSTTLGGGGRSQTATRSRHRARHALMGAQVALALVLLISSGLMLRSFWNLRAVDPGFDPASALTFTIGLPERDYPTVASAVAAHQAIIDSVAALPGVARVSATTCLPLAGGCFGNSVRIEGRAEAPGAPVPIAVYRAVAGGYFEAMGIHVVRGRTIDRSDVERRAPIVVVSQTFADRLFPNENPIGQRVASNRPGELTWLTIEGVVADTPSRALAEPNPLAQVYMPMSISGGPGVPPRALVGPDVAALSYVVRTAVRPDAMLPSIRSAVDGVDRNLALAQARTLQEVLSRASGQMAFTMVLLAIAASVTLALGVVGIYGVTSYIVTQRTAEIGVRLALGAVPGEVAAMIARQGGAVAAAGVAAGLAAAFAGSRVIGSLLFRVSAHDPAVFAAAAVLLLAVALCACWLPARRAARLNPLDALRAE